MKAAMIRPGLLVSLKSTVKGGVHYERKDLDTDKTRSKWETTRIIEDPAEHERAVKARAKALGEIRSICSPSSFGLLCAEANEALLDAAIVKAQQIRNDHNAASTFTRFDIYVLKGRIAATDDEAARAIAEEMASLIGEMSAGIEQLKPESIREAANRARQLASMLTPEKAKEVEGAVEAARKAARQIVKRVEKDGEAAAIVLADIQTGGIERARMAFLDLSDHEAVSGKTMPAVQTQRFADLDDAQEKQ